MKELLHRKNSWLVGLTVCSICQVKTDDKDV